MKTHWFKLYNGAAPQLLRLNPDQAFLEVEKDSSSQTADSTPILFKAEPMSYGELERPSRFLRVFK